MQLRAGVASDCGLVRPANEDSFILRRGLYAVCDGMGGARAGEVASQMACLGLLDIDPGSAGADELREAVVKANTSIIKRSTNESGLTGMGTTLTAALVVEGTLFIAHVGDSRAYLLHEGGLAQITADHSWVGEMVRRGEITPEQAARHPHRSVITRAIGTDMVLEPDVIELQVQPGDRLLLCSDGLTGMVDDQAVAEIMSLPSDAQATADSLVEAALQNGGEDNVTVVIVDVQADGAGDHADKTSSIARILIGPSDRESSLPLATRGVERLSMAARERLRKRSAQARAGSAGSEDSVAPEDGSDEAAVAASAKSGRKPKKEAATPEAERKKRRPSRRRTWLVVVVIALLLVVLAGGGFAWYNSTVYYLGETEGKVALYRGLPWELGAIEFSSVYRLEEVDYDSLFSFERERVESHELMSKEEGDRFMDGLSTAF